MTKCCLLLLIFSAAVTIGWADPCVCQPIELEFQFDFTKTCADKTHGDSSPGISDIYCMVFNDDDGSFATDPSPVSVHKVYVSENGNQYGHINLEADFMDHDTFAFQTIISTDPDSIDDIPRWWNFYIYGTNAAGRDIRLVFVVTFLNDCVTYPIMVVGDNLAWIDIRDLVEPPIEWCPLVGSHAPSTQPSVIPSASPSAWPTAVPTASPSTTAPPLSPSAEPTPIITPAPIAPTPAPGPSPWCFSDRNQVQVKGKGATRMDDLNIGDAVLTGDGTFAKVYSFGHRAPHEEVEFLQIHTFGTDKSLEISKEHMFYVYRDSKKTLLPAGDVKVGDFLVSTQRLPVQIQSIRTITRHGAYAPFTVTGDIVVSDVVASNYIAFPSVFQDRASFYLQHWISHAMLAPYRTFCAMVGCEGETYNEVTGISDAVTRILPLLYWLERHSLVILPLFVYLVAVPCYWIMFINMPHLVAVVLGYYVWKKQTNK